MGAPDLKVNYDLLGEYQNNLTFVKNEFAGLHDQIHTLDHDSVWGADEVKHAMDTFQGNWKIHREKLEKSIDTLLEMVQKTVGYFQEADQELAKALHDDNTPAPSTGKHG